MTIPTKLWLALALSIITIGAAWCAGYRYADARWTQRDTDRQLADAKAAHDLSEQYRLKEQKLNEHIGTIDTRAINDAAQAEAEYRADVERLRSGNWLHVKPAITCKVPNSATTSGNGHEEIQAGLSTEVAERVVGIGAECDQVVISLDACQAYVESLRNEKPPY